MLSGYCKKIAEKYNISIGLVRKLIPMLKDKKEYVLHYRNLQLYMDLGLKMKKVHRVLELTNPLGLSSTLTLIPINESMLRKGLLQAYEQFSLWEDHGKFAKESKR